MRTTISEDADIQRLVRAIIAQAVRDLYTRDPVKQLDALLWLTGPDFGWWSEAMNAPFMDPFKMLSIGGAKKLRGRA
jgi:hypothetical protein